MVKKEHEKRIAEDEVAKDEQEPDTLEAPAKSDDEISPETLGSIEQDADEQTGEDKEDEKFSEESGNLQKSLAEGKFRRFLGTKKGKWAIAVTLIGVLLVILTAVPTTRYGMLGYFIKKDVRIVVLDSVTNKPVSQATITLGPVTAMTNGAGQVTMSHVPAGEYTLKIDKKYYKEGTIAYTVPVLGNAGDINQSLVATGRQVAIHVINKITQTALAKATIVVADTSATTDSNGNASIVLPANQKTLNGTVSLNGYNQAKVTVQVTDQTDSNNFTLVPSGNLFYLSKETGTINVMKSDLDGSNASVIVQGTGNEADSSTTLLATRDWKYLVLSANRDPSQQSQVYLINASTGKLTLIDEATDNVYFSLVGWSDHRFVYLVSRNLSNWTSGNQTLKSFNAETGAITALDQTTAYGSSNFDYQRESIQSPYIAGDKITYTKSWDVPSFATTQQKPAIMVVNADGAQKQRLQEFTIQHSVQMDSRLYAPSSVYFRVAIDSQSPAYYEYEDGALKGIDLPDSTFYAGYPAYTTYLVSPTGRQTLWSEPRDGKNTIFVGDQNGAHPMTLANESDYNVYGWYSDSYVLLSKNGSELYIAPASANFGNVIPLKVTNYHKPAQSLYGYGSGYGGL